MGTEIEKSGFYFTGSCMIAGSVVLYALPWAKTHSSNQTILADINSEAHSSDVTVAMIPQMFGFGQNEINDNIVADGSVPPNTPATTPIHTRQHMVNVVHPSLPKPRHVRLKHKALNKLVQEINGHVNRMEGDLSWSTKTVQCVSERQAGTDDHLLSPGALCEAARAASAPDVAARARDRRAETITLQCGTSAVTEV